MAVATPRESWRDALDIKLSLLDWLRDPRGKRWMQVKEHLEGQEYQEDTRILLRSMFAAVEPQLASAKTFFASRDMCRLVEAAAQTFEPEEIYPTDLLTLDGFLLFERPFVIPDRFDDPVSIKAVSWSPACSNQELDKFRPLTREDEMMEWLEDRHSRGIVDGLTVTLYQDMQPDRWSTWEAEGWPLPPIEPLHITPWWWGMSFTGNEVTEAGIESGAEWWWKIVQTAFRLMQQRITVRHSERPARPQRRDLKRRGMPEQDVTVITLRREHERQNHEPVDGGRTYSHRWIVEGHWRNQWYRSENKHRQIWIADYEKGPEGSPLIIKPRAYAWTR